jgi:uncharacterized protein (DUF1800 family)
VGAEEYESTSNVLADAAVGSGDAGRLNAWWVWRMLRTPDPLGERLTLLWHDHFATSQLKVNDLGAMRRQNETLRRLARAPFGELLHAMVRDPALLVWLDGPTNRKGHPNENLARELMELFTIGVGQFGESDVKEAARALTGLSVAEGQFREASRTHDDGPKTVLGKTGRWTAGDLLGILLDHPRTAERLARRICEAFVGHGVVGEPEIAALAEGLRARNRDIGWAVRTVVRSRIFLGDTHQRTRVVGPAEFVVGPVSALQVEGASTLLLADWIGGMGQDLFHPPNVGGWPGGRSWLGSMGVMARVRFAAGLVDGRAVGCGGALDLAGLADRHGVGKSAEERLAWFSRLILGRELNAGARGAVLGCVKGISAADGARRMVADVLVSPAAQVV